MRLFEGAGFKHHDRNDHERGSRRGTGQRYRGNQCPCSVRVASEPSVRPVRVSIRWHTRVHEKAPVVERELSAREQDETGKRRGSRRLRCKQFRGWAGSTRTCRRGSRRIGPQPRDEAALELNGSWEMEIGRPGPGSRSDPGRSGYLTADRPTTAARGCRSPLAYRRCSVPGQCVGIH